MFAPWICNVKKNQCPMPICTGPMPAINIAWSLIKDEVLLTVGCPIFLPFYIYSQISVHRKFKKIDQLIFRNAKEIYFNETFPII
jgi:hypothetical protein